MASLDELIEVLNCSLTARCRDEGGDMRIVGRVGHIYAQPEGYYIYYSPGSPRAWTNGKKEMSFCKVTQDGDDEGFLLLDHLPGKLEAEIILDRIGIRRRKVISEKERERLSKVGSTLRSFKKASAAPETKH